MVRVTRPMLLEQTRHLGELNLDVGTSRTCYQLNVDAPRLGVNYHAVLDVISHNMASSLCQDTE